MQYKISCVAETGATHRNQGKPNQNRVVSRRENGNVAIVLCDGSASRYKSQVGADVITRELSQLLCSRFADLYEAESFLLRRMLLQHCITALRQTGYPLDQLACTLIFAAADQQGRCIIGHLGDGVMLQMGQTIESLWTLSHPEYGETASENWFVTSPGAEAHLRLHRGPLPNSGAMLLMSDGAALSFYVKDTEVPSPACLTLAQWLRDGKEEDIRKAMLFNLQKQLSCRDGDDMSLGLLVWGQDLPHPHKETRVACYPAD